LRVCSLVQVLLPLYTPAGAALPRALFAQVRGELLQKFGGLTAYTRAPAEGLWEEASGALARDDVVVHEVLCDAFDEAWWAQYQSALERRFEQQEVLIRVHEVRTL
jgi:hypothetical protein